MERQKGPRSSYRKAKKRPSKKSCPTSPYCQQLMAAMQEFHTKTCIRFQQWFGQPHQVHITRKGKDCSSDFGMRPNEPVQYLILGDSCWTGEQLIYHLCRIIGLQHKSFRARAFGEWTQRPMTRKVFVYQDENAVLEQFDAERIRRLYDCMGDSEPRLGFPIDMNCLFNRHMCGFTSRGELEWKLFQTGGVLCTINQDGLKEHLGTLVSPVFHGRNIKNKGNDTGCLDFWYMTQGHKIYNMKVIQRTLSAPLQPKGFEETLMTVLWYSGDVVHPMPSKDNYYHHVFGNLNTVSPFLVEIEVKTGWSVIAIDDFRISYKPCPKFKNNETQEYHWT